MTDATDQGVERRSIWYRLYNGLTAFDFVGRRNAWFIGSAAVIALGLVGLIGQGLNLGIDFRGGTAWEVPANGKSVGEARDALRPLGLAESKVQTLRGSGGSRLRVQAEVKGKGALERKDDVTRALAKLTRTTVAEVSVNDVGPSWGKDVTRKAQRALVVFFLLISLYIWFRFELKMAIAALSAVVHDILVTTGVYALSGFEVTPATVVAFLTILGYSLYDTIVVFDKVDENTRGLAASGRMTYGDVVNLSMNQVLMRSINTSIVAVLPVASILFLGAFVLGATTLRDFGLALMIGLITGAYSSIFIASPVLAILKEREPRYAAIRARIVARGGAGVLLTPAAAAASGAGSASMDVEEVAAPAGRQAATARTPRSAPRPSRPAPRPRKKGRRR